MKISSHRSPFSVKNVRLFIAFRLFFTARFYYPVFSILFLDFGLSISEFALLNAIWAAVIVVAEVPSGALADTIGRRHLLVATGAMMVAELSLLCVAPRGGGTLLFGMFLVNRILSGLAEASASGADEALAYDALKHEGMENQWGRVLEVQMRVQSLAFVGAMVSGGLMYDPEVMGRLFSFLGIDLVVTQGVTLRIPLVMTLILGFLTLGCALAMEEPLPRAGTERPSIGDGFKMTCAAGRWIFATPFALAVIGAGLIFDGVMRMVITLSSQYYRAIGLPEASFGVIGALVAALGVVTPRLARHLAETHAPFFNLMVIFTATTISLIWMTFFSPFFGLFPALFLFAAMGTGTFFISHYLHHLAASEIRATVLSFKGLAYNMSYGLMGGLYAAIVAMRRGPLGREYPHLTGLDLEDRLFMETFGLFPQLFLVLMAFFMLGLLGKRVFFKERPRGG